jgi:hypothetical protein
MLIRSSVLVRFCSYAWSSEGLPRIPTWHCTLSSDWPNPYGRAGSLLSVESVETKAVWTRRIRQDMS